MDVVGESPAMREVLRQIDRVARVASTVLITGESGTGKELVARAIHARGARAGGVFLPVNVAAIPRDLIESQLYGHERGAFSGAEQARAGAFRMAHGGTLCLDEVAELPLEAQAKLLRALETKEVWPVGSDGPVPVDVRLLASTHRNLEQLVDAGQFRLDLYFRLDVVRIHLPPLRERTEDIPALVEHLIQRCARALGVAPPRVEEAVMNAWLTHGWRGNVRELANVIERTTLLGDGVAVRVRDLPAGMRCGLPEPAERDLERATAEFQRRHIRRVLDEVGGHRRAAAARLGISESTLYRRLEALEPRA